MSLFNILKTLVFNSIHNPHLFLPSDMGKIRKEVIINNIKIKYRYCLNKKAQVFENSLFELAQNFEQESKNIHLVKAKQLLIELENILQNKNYNFERFELVEMNEIYYKHHNWVYGYSYNF